jgi:hypothetical protein
MIEPTDFSLAKDRPLSRLLQRLGLGDGATTHTIVIAAITWLPLLVLSALSGVAVGNNVKAPFLLDYGVYGRLLVAMPVLLFAEAPIGVRTRDVVREFVTAKLIREQDKTLFYEAVHDATKRKEAVMPEIIILALIYIALGIRAHIALSDPLTTWYRWNGSITPAGWYYVLVSLPIFQFLLFRWIWRLITWTILLWKISRLDLQLLPIHPDKMGGLGFIGLAQIPFGLIAFAGGAVISSYLINNMVYRGVSLGASSAPMVGYVIMATLVIAAPILVFTNKLIGLRANGILRYSELGEEYARLFDDKWAKGINPECETILGSSDIQSLADLRNSFDIVGNMSIVALDRKTITVIAATAAIPMVPMLFIALPFEEIIARALGLHG